MRRRERWVGSRGPGTGTGVPQPWIPEVNKPGQGTGSWGVLQNDLQIPHQILLATSVVRSLRCARMYQYLVGLCMFTINLKGHRWSLQDNTRLAVVLFGTAWSIDFTADHKNSHCFLTHPRKHAMFVSARQNCLKISLWTRTTCLSENNSVAPDLRENLRDVSHEVRGETRGGVSERKVCAAFRKLCAVPVSRRCCGRSRVPKVR